MKIERAKLGNYLGQTCLEQMLSGLQETFGPEVTAALVRRAGEQLGYDIAQDWHIRADLITPERLPLLLQAALGEQGHNLGTIHSVSFAGGSLSVTGSWPTPPLIREMALGTLHGLLSRLLEGELARPTLSEHEGHLSATFVRRALLQAS